MKHIVSFSFVLFAFSSFAQQKETFDLATYTIPARWKQVNKTANVITYAITNEQKGTYCQIGIYRSTTSKGSLQSDFESEWQELIVKTYKPSAKPTLVPAESENGWDAKGGAAAFDFNGAQSVAMLVTMSGYGRCLSIVILTNTEDYQSQIENFLESVDLEEPAMSTPTMVADNQNVAQVVSRSATHGAYRFSTTTFDDGWTSTAREDWVEVVKGNIKVLIHYPNKKADAYNSVVMDGLKIAWNLLVAPKYSSASNFEFKPLNGWQTIEFAEADAVEAGTGRSVHVVLFKMGYSNGSGKYLEFITPDKKSFEQEFGPYHETTYGWEKMERMANYNKFAIAATDLQGKWTNDFSGALQYVNAYTGSDAGMASHASNESFEFGAGNTYKWDLGVASGMVGNIKFQSAKASGTFSLPNNWQVTFSDIEGKSRTYNAFFSCLKGARLLWFGDTAYGRME